MPEFLVGLPNSGPFYGLFAFHGLTPLAVQLADVGQAVIDKGSAVLVRL